MKLTDSLNAQLVQLNKEVLALKAENEILKRNTLKDREELDRLQKIVDYCKKEIAELEQKSYKQTQDILTILGK